jgi:hypothetical protein
MNARNGKIARLSPEIRQQLNQRLEMSEQSPDLLPWLNALPEVQAILKKNFDGVPVSRQNLSEWRQGGFQEWLARRDFAADVSDATRLVEDLDEASREGELADYAATVLAARFTVLLARWNGEVDEQFEAKTRVLNRLCHSVVQLQRGTHQSIRDTFQMEVLAGEKAKKDDAEEKAELLAPLKSKLQIPIWSQMFGGGKTGHRIADFIWAVENGRDFKTGLRPEDEYMFEQLAARARESAKADVETASVKKPHKTKSKKVSKRRKTNDIASTPPPPNPPVPANPVKLNQTLRQ